jgi:mono/diheme cytochrome c family protein
MIRTLLLFASALLWLTPGLQAAPLELKSVKIDLPTGDRMFPDGPGADAINNNCLACHSAGMVLDQPALPKAAWATEVNKMINVYKAPVDPGDVDAIVDYLSRMKVAK